MLRMKKISDKNRSRLEIIAEILRKLREPTVKTNIMSHCNMNIAQSDAIVRDLTYQRTQVGRGFLELDNQMLLWLDKRFCAISNVAIK